MMIIVVFTSTVDNLITACTSHLPITWQIFSAQFQMITQIILFSTKPELNFLLAFVLKPLSHQKLQSVLDLFGKECELFERCGDDVYSHLKTFSEIIDPTMRGNKEKQLYSNWRLASRRVWRSVFFFGREHDVSKTKIWSTMQPRWAPLQPQSQAQATWR